MTNNKNGFGVGTLVVIIALVLIIGGYMYYSNQDTVPAETTDMTAETADMGAEATMPAGQMETGTAAPVAPGVVTPAAQ